MKKSPWTEIDESSIRKNAVGRAVTPNAYRIFRLDKAALRAELSNAPKEGAPASAAGDNVILLPMPDGSLSRFRIEHSPIVELGLAAKYPELNETYRGQGIDDPSATVRLDFLPEGFHSMILSSRGTVLVDPYAPGDTENYITYYKRDAPRGPSFSCEVTDTGAVQKLFTAKNASLESFVANAAPSVVSGGTLRTYRIAVAATNEYAATVGSNTVAGTLAAQVLVMNRVNGVYERDVAIRMVLVANNDRVIYATDSSCGGAACSSANDPFTNDDGVAMLSENQSTLNSRIGSSNYDIGHVFSTGGGGVATLNGPCRNSKAQGVTGLANPVGDPFTIDYVAHEIGHQWGAQHTFNGLTSSCSDNRSAGSAYEPGSGITIMAYAGICDAQNLAAHSIDTFHAKSLQDIITYSQNGDGSACAIQTPTANTPPSISIVGGPSFNVPKQTPFTLTASATDANADAITYDWQQFDLGAGAFSVPNSDADGVARPIFRAYAPSSRPSRTFPSEQFIRSNANIPPATLSGFLTGEVLPAIGRSMTFQVIARDNRAGGGGISTAIAIVAVDGGGGPFNVTAPNGGDTWTGGQTRTVTWDVANTTAAPVSAANVKITLSTDGGVSFPTTLVTSTPNDGSHDLVVPSANTDSARIRVEAAGNIFFDISNANFAITSASAGAGLIAGRITTAAGFGLPRVWVELRNVGGQAERSVLTNHLGYFNFIDVPFAQYSIVPRQRKRYSFSPESITRSFQSNAADVDFTAVVN
ncbi:MAG: reprolysin-like metallopeptidase [Pyrinomonadaceae bacterium]